MLTSIPPCQFVLCGASHTAAVVTAANGFRTTTEQLETIARLIQSNRRAQIQLPRRNGLRRMLSERES